jgi:hypothetical protein
MVLMVFNIAVSYENCGTQFSYESFGAVSKCYTAVQLFVVELL